MTYAISSAALTGTTGHVVAVHAETDPADPTSPAGKARAGEEVLTRDTRDRLYAAIRNSGERWPGARIWITGEPTGQKQSPCRHDLAAAVAILTAAGTIPAGAFERTVVVGELALNGDVRPVGGILPSVIAARAANIVRVIVSVADLPEAGLTTDIEVLGAASLSDVIRWAHGDHTALHAPDPADTTDLTSATPVEIDTELAHIYGRLNEASAALAHAHKQRDRTVELGYLDLLPKLDVVIATASTTIAECTEQARPLESEFTRRGGWTRAYLVNNTNGHVHRWTQCRTCYPSTQFYWVTALSGADEDHIVGEAGEKACTDCYPSAPVDVLRRPSRIKTPDQIARAAQKAARAEAKAAKAITAPDGGPLRTKRDGIIRTEVTARREYADTLSYARSLKATRRTIHEALIAECEHDAELILAALAAKHDTTVEDMRAELAVSVDKKWKRDHGR